MAALLLVAALVAAGQGAPSAQDPTALPGSGVELPGPRHPASPATARPAPSPLPTAFTEPTGTTLLVEVGGREAVAVELDSGRRAAVPLPGQRPGDQPFRLWPAGDDVVVGWGEIWVVSPGDGQRRKLGDATVFVPDSDPDRLWLIDYEGGRIGVGAATWTLVGSDDGHVIHQADGPDGQFAIRGVPDGLALRGPEGLLRVYDPATGRISPYLDEQARYIGDVGPDQVVWCGETCQSLVIEGRNGTTRIDGGRAGAFHPRSVWLSDGGAHVAALTPVVPEVDPRLVVFDATTGELLHESAALPNHGSIEGTWTQDGQFLYLFPAADRAGAGTGLAVGRWTVGSHEWVQIDALSTTRALSLVAYPSCALREVLDDPAAHSTARCPDGPAG